MIAVRADGTTYLPGHVPGFRLYRGHLRPLMHALRCYLSGSCVESNNKTMAM